MEEALNFSGVLLVYVVALIGFTIFLWCLGIKVREYIFLARVIQRNLSLIVGTAIKVVPMGSQLLAFFLRSLKPKSKKPIKTEGRLEPSFATDISNKRVSDHISLDKKTGKDGFSLEISPSRLNKSFSDVSSSLKIEKKPKDKRQNNQVSLDLIQEGEYQFPVLDLLSVPKKISINAPEKSALEANAKLLESVLQDFGVKGEIVQVRTGPVVTLYELEPAPGTKSSRVIGLGDDIARSMSAVSVRVAVVPGRNVIGIELPNHDREMVFLRELFQSPEYAEAKDKLPIALGKDISGSPVVVDLARMPHLLIAGTTG